MDPSLAGGRNQQMNIKNLLIDFKLLTNLFFITKHFFLKKL